MEACLASPACLDRVDVDEHQIINHVLDFYRELIEHAVARLHAKGQTDSSLIPRARWKRGQPKLAGEPQ